MCQSLIQTVPALSWPATSSARWLSVLQTPADSPYSVSLGSGSPDRLSARITDRTGPKISSRAIVMSLVTSVKIVGSTQKPCSNLARPAPAAVGQRSALGLAAVDVAQDPRPAPRPR